MSFQVAKKPKGLNFDSFLRLQGLKMKLTEAQKQQELDMRSFLIVSLLLTLLVGCAKNDESSIGSSSSSSSSSALPQPEVDCGGDPCIE